RVRSYDRKARCELQPECGARGEPTGARSNRTDRKPARTGQSSDGGTRLKFVGHDEGSLAATPGTFSVVDSPRAPRAGGREPAGQQVLQTRAAGRVCNSRRGRPR